MSAYTKGPWTYHAMKKGDFPIISNPSLGGQAIGQVWRNPSGNAPLIVASPDMYEALQALLGVYGRDEHPTAQEALNKARAAIAKAEGK